MLAIVRLAAIFVINFLVARGLIPEDFGKQITSDPEAMLAIELAIAAVATLLIASGRTILQTMPAFIKSMMAATVLRWSQGKVKLEDHQPIIGGETKDDKGDESNVG